MVSKKANGFKDDARNRKSERLWSRKMAERKSFMVYLDWEDECSDLTDEEQIQLVHAAFQYVRNGEEPTFSERAVRIAWIHIKKSLDMDADRYEAKCEQNRINGKKGGRPKKEETEKANGFFKNPKKPITDIRYPITDNPYPITDNPIKEFENEKLDQTFKEYLRYRNVGSDMEKEKIKQQLVLVGNTNEDDMIKILDQSMANGWKGLFPLSRYTSGGKKPIVIGQGGWE